MFIEQHTSLRKYNTFGIDIKARYFVEINTLPDFAELLENPFYTTSAPLVLGGGSNVLFTRNYDGIVVRNNLKGIEIAKENEEYVWVKVAAGENWHHFVMWCVQHNYSGVENLSLIPGCVGASPMQNIGAYGVEIKDVCEEVHALDLQSGEKRIFSNGDCKFGYRESVFKNTCKDRYFITEVIYRLRKKPVFNTSYGAIEQELKEMGISTLSVKAISDAVIRIRSSKLPDPAVMGNAGSFFKNPEISAQKHAGLKEEFPKLVSYFLDNGNYKLAAGWLIEYCGFKGKKYGHAGVHDKQALVLINTGGASGDEIFRLSEEIIEKVNETFGVILEREVNIY